MVRLTLEVTAGDLDGNYDVQWYVGSVGDTSTPITDGVTTINNSTISITPATSVDGSQQSVISNLPEGTYWAQVNDNMTGNLGCTVSAQGTVNENFTDVTLDLAAVSAAATDKSHCLSHWEPTTMVQSPSTLLTSLQEAVLLLLTTPSNLTEWPLTPMTERSPLLLLRS